MIDRIRSGLTFLEKRRQKKEFIQYLIENHWGASYGLDVTLLDDSFVASHMVSDHRLNMEYADKESLKPVSYTKLKNNDIFNSNDRTVVLFDTATNVFPGNHWLMVAETDDFAVLRFCSTFGNRVLKYKDGRNVDIFVPVDEEFFTGFTVMRYTDKSTGEVADILEVTERGFEKFKAKDSGKIYFSTAAGIVIASERD